MLHSPSSERVHPFLVLPLSILSLTCAGTIYWWPAITPGIKRALNFSSTQADILVAVAGSGSTVGILGGLFHDRHGTRLTAIAGSAGLTFSFITLALLTAIRPLFLGPLLFPLVFLLVVSIVTFSFMMYSSCITAAAAVFPSRFRGRVVGLGSTAFGACAGVLTAMQTAFFTSLANTPVLLSFVAAVCFTPGILAFLFFPRTERFDPLSMTLSEEETPLAAQTPEEASTSKLTYITKLLNAAYLLAWVYVALLQVAAVADIFQVNHSTMVIIATMLIGSLLSFFTLHARSSLKIGSSDSTSSGSDDDTIGNEPLFSMVIRDPRYLYGCLNCLVLVGGGGVAMLVQAPTVVQAFSFATTPTDIAAWVRTIVATFAASSVTARLLVGSMMDWGENAEARQLWKFRLLHTNALVMATGILLVGSGWRIGLLAGVTLIGLAYGAFFSVAATLTTIWFGVRNFPRNFAVFGPFIATGAATLASSVPMWLRASFGTWTTDAVGDAVCVGTECVVPTTALLMGLQVATFGVGLSVWPSVRRGAVAMVRK